MTEVRLAGAGGAIIAVKPGSPAEAADIRPSDRLIAINGRKLRDVIDYQFYSNDELLSLEVEREGVAFTLDVQNEDGAPLGLEFADPTFDRLRTCNNNCPFCFLKGLPRGLRRTLYIKDDDYRYSFLFGNFVTLTNLTERDWARIFEQHLTPLYVSVHATEPEVRRQLLGNPRAPEIMPQIDAMAEAGLQVHTQVVLCPGQNDGIHLERTIRDLSSRYPTVQSIGVVPVGLTPRQTDLLARGARQDRVAAVPDGGRPVSKEREEYLQALRTTTHCERVVPGAVRLYRPDEASAVVSQVTPFQREFRKRFGTTLTYLADEFYLMAGAGVPSERSYDGYPQYENGIGMVRTLMEEWRRTKKRLSVSDRPLPRKKAAIGCGLLPAVVLRPIVAEMNELGLDVTLVPIRNEFFGSSVTVSGLLTGSDVHANFSGSGFDVIFLPRYMLDTPGVRTLDGWTPDDIRAQLGTEVVFTTSLSTVATTLTRR